MGGLRDGARDFFSFHAAKSPFNSFSLIEKPLLEYCSAGLLPVFVTAPQFASWFHSCLIRRGRIRFLSLQLARGWHESVFSEKDEQEKWDFGKGPELI